MTEASRAAGTGRSPSQAHQGDTGQRGLLRDIGDRGEAARTGRPAQRAQRTGRAGRARRAGRAGRTRGGHRASGPSGTQGVRGPGRLVPGAARAHPDPDPQRRTAPLRHRARLHRRAVRPHPLHPVDRHPELPGPAARHPVLGLVPDRPDLGRGRHRPAVPAGPRPRPAAQPEPADALAGPGAGDHPLGDARGRRRHHVAARLQPGRRRSSTRPSGTSDSATAGTG